MIGLLGLFCFAEDYLQVILDDSGDQIFASKNLEAAPGLSVEDIYDSTISIKKDGREIISGQFEPALKRLGVRGKQKLLEVPPMPQFPITEQGGQAKRLWLELQEIKLEKPAYRGFKRFLMELHRSNLDKADFNGILSARGDSSPSPFPMVDRSLLETVNPIPTKRIETLLRTWNALNLISHKNYT